MRKGRIRVRVVGRRPPAEDGLRAVYQQVLRSFATTGHAPPAADLAETADRYGTPAAPHPAGPGLRSVLLEIFMPPL